MTEREKFEAWCKAEHWKPTESMWAAWEATSLSRLKEQEGLMDHLNQEPLDFAAALTLLRKARA